MWGVAGSLPIDSASMRRIHLRRLVAKAIATVAQSLDCSVLPVGSLAQAVSNRGWCDRLSVDPLRMIDDILGAQRLSRTREYCNHDVVHPPRSWPCGFLRDRFSSFAAFDGRSDLGHAPKLNPGFRVRTCSRQLYFEGPRAARSSPCQGWFDPGVRAGSVLTCRASLTAENNPARVGELSDPPSDPKRAGPVRVLM